IQDAYDAHTQHAPPSRATCNVAFSSRDLRVESYNRDTVSHLTSARRDSMMGGGAERQLPTSAPVHNSAQPPLPMHLSSPCCYTHTFRQPTGSAQRSCGLPRPLVQQSFPAPGPAAGLCGLAHPWGRHWQFQYRYSHTRNKPSQCVGAHVGRMRIRPRMWRYAHGTRGDVDGRNGAAGILQASSVLGWVMKGGAKGFRGVCGRLTQTGTKKTGMGWLSEVFGADE
ncbi:hypothetical protein JB92DRAFT_3245730, partial [Gautieria morchelliformis]